MTGAPRQDSLKTGPPMRHAERTPPNSPAMATYEEAPTASARATRSSGANASASVQKLVKARVVKAVGQSHDFKELRSQLKLLMSPTLSPLDWDMIGRMQDEEAQRELEQEEKETAEKEDEPAALPLKDHKTATKVFGMEAWRAGRKLGESCYRRAAGQPFKVMKYGERIKLSQGDAWVIPFDAYQLADPGAVAALDAEDRDPAGAVRWTQEFEQTYGVFHPMAHLHGGLWTQDPDAMAAHVSHFGGRVCGENGARATGKTRAPGWGAASC